MTKDHLKVGVRQRLHRHWKRSIQKDPAEDLVPLLSLGVFAMVAGAILIAFTVGQSQFLVILGTVGAVFGALTITMALVLATLRRGSKKKQLKNRPNKQP